MVCVWEGGGGQVFVLCMRPNVMTWVIFYNMTNLTHKYTDIGH